MSNLIEKLLGSGANVLDLPKAEFEVSRLSQKIGQPFLIKARALTAKELDDCPQGDDFRAHVILAAVSDPNFRDKDLAQKLSEEKGRKSPLTPVEVIATLLLPGELANLYSEISALSGWSVDAVVKVEEEIEKN